MLTGNLVWNPVLNLLVSLILSKEMMSIKEHKPFFNYDVYEDGKVFSHYVNRFLKGEITKFGYLQYTLYVDGESKRYKAHRLVAFLFLNRPENYNELPINHKDGNKLNNYYSNLEYCTTDYNNYHARKNKLNDISLSNSKRWEDCDFRERTSKHFSENHKKLGCCRGKNNGRFRYIIQTILGKELTRQELASLLNKSQSYTDALIKRSANGENIKLFTDVGIYIKDTKREVNRLSKATDNEKDVTR